MKRNILNMSAALLLSATTLSSCNDFLEIEPQNIVTIDQFWNEESDVESVVNGCYSAMQSYGMIARMMIWGEFRSENIVSYANTIESDVNLERILDENITANNAYTDWTEFYQVINRCNIIIERAPKVAANDPAYTSSEMWAHIAEATALRSLCYFYLIRTFRDVPYSEEAFLDDNQTLDLPATPFEDVLARLISSLESVKDYAVTKYPEGTGYAKYYDTGRITRTAIYAMLCEMYLWQNDYANCIKYADLVIERKLEEAEESEHFFASDYSDFNGFPLIASRLNNMSTYFGAAFNDIFVTGNSSEGILELTFVGNDGTTLSNGPVSNFYGNNGRSPFCKGSDYIAEDISKATPVVYNNKYDGRAYENFYYKGGEVSGINKYSNSTGVNLYDPSVSTSFLKNSSWGTFYDTYGSGYDSRNKSNFILYRLTDIMLLKAEALTQQISDDAVLNDDDLVLRDQAFTLVNAVNKRSLYQTTLKDTLVMSNYATKLDITNLVYDERERELMFEGKRYYDLVRRARREGNTSYLKSKVKLKSTDNASVIENQFEKMDRMYWPYNLDETKVNKNLKQNSAFSSGENSSYSKTAN